MKRKPLMVAATEFWDGATGSGMVSGFRGLGWRVQMIDHGAFAGNAKSFAVRVAARLSRQKLQQDYRDAIWSECEALRPHVFFTVKGAGLDAALLARIQSQGTRTVMYYPDFHFDHAGVDQSSFDFYDLFVTTKSFQLEWLRERLGPERVAHVPHGYTDALFQPVFDAVPEPDHGFDVLYVGNHSPYKQAWLARLLELSPGLKLGVVGNRWREQKQRLGIEASSMPGEVRGLRLAKLIQSARINLGLHFGKTASGWEDLVSRRTFEIPACKGFMLHIDNPEVRGLFEVGREIDVFDSPEGLNAKIQYYLARPELRAQMIESAYARAVPTYGHASRAAQIDGLIRAAAWQGSCQHGRADPPGDQIDLPPLPPAGEY